VIWIKTGSTTVVPYGQPANLSKAFNNNKQFRDYQNLVKAYETSKSYK